MQASQNITPVSQIADLHAARGIAAAIVLFHHISLVHQTNMTTRLTLDTVLNAHGAVIFFFVLSGYVLTASMVRSGVTRVTVMQFITRRAFRIYPALIAAFVLALAVWALGEPAGQGDKTGWYIRYSDRFFESEMSWLEVLQNLIPVSFVANPPTWSIFTELVGSACIPLIVFWFRRGTGFMVAGLALFLVLSAIFVGKSGGFHYLNFMVFFALGAVVFFHNPLIRLTRPVLWGLAGSAAVALLLCRMVYKVLVFGEMSPIEVYNSDWVMALLEGGFAMVLIACLAAPQWRNNTLRMPAILGDYSYSIYLMHFPMIWLAVWLSAEIPALSSDSATIAVFWIGIPALTFAAAGLSFRFLEKPAIRAGRVVSAKLATGTFASARPVTS
ncbi:MAG: acyltransferase [Sulfitobacter sp.]